MKWQFAGMLSAIVLSVTVGQGWADDGCASCGSGGCKDKCCKCITPPEPACADCSDPCEKNRIGGLLGKKHVNDLIDKLCSGDCKERIKAAKKLGCRLHADFCDCPDVLNALAKALLCDSCWEVRRAAAWAIAFQGARVNQGIVALYVASRLDPHYLVRDSATDALDVLLVCRRPCYKELLAGADGLVKQMRGKYNPTKGDCIHLDQLSQCCASAAAGPELVPAPKDNAKGEE